MPTKKVIVRRDDDKKPLSLEIVEGGKKLDVAYEYSPKGDAYSIVFEGRREDLPSLTDIVKIVDAKRLDRIGTIELIDLITLIKKIEEITKIGKIEEITKFSAAEMTSYFGGTKTSSGDTTFSAPGAKAKVSDVFLWNSGIADVRAGIRIGVMYIFRGLLAPKCGILKTFVKPLLGDTDDSVYINADVVCTLDYGILLEWV